MSYPPVRFRGEHGVRSAVLRPADAPPDLVSPTTEVAYLATAVSSEGGFGLYRYAMTGPGGPAPHFHRTMSESFFVLSGTVRLFDGRHWVDGRPGDFLHVPAGGVHAFGNDSGERAEMLLLFAPGAPRERYFEELAARARDGRPFADDGEALAFQREHDQYPA